MINIKLGESVLEDSLKRITDPPTGVPLNSFPTLNRLLGGLRPNELTLFGAPTGSGKTHILAQITADLITNDHKVFAAPVETGHVDFLARIVSVLNKKDLNTGEKFSRSDYAAGVDKHFHALNKNIVFSTHSDRVDVEEMVATLHYAHDVYGTKVAVLDNLNFFLKVTSEKNMLISYDEAIHAFVMLARKVPMHIILVMHPKKPEGPNRTLKLLDEFSLKGSSTAVQEADNVLLMSRLAPEEIPLLGSKYTREFHFAKIRRRGFNQGVRFYMNMEQNNYVDKKSF